MMNRRVYYPACLVGWLVFLIQTQLFSPGESLGQESAPTTAPVEHPRLSVANPVVNLGNIQEGGVYDFGFELHNEGQVPLIIQKIRSSCGCTVAKLDQQTIAPGATVTLNAGFDSKGRIGKQSKTITVVSNDPLKPEQVLSFEAMVEALYNVLPSRFLSFGNIRPGDSIDKTIKILAGKTGSEIQVLDVTMNKPGLSYTSKAIEENGIKGHELAFALDEKAPVGSFSAVADVSIKIADQSAHFKLPISGQVVADINVFPRMLLSLSSGALLPGEPLAQGRITLQSINPEKPFQILHVESGRAFTCDVEEVQPGLEYYIHVKIAPQAAPGPTGRTITIFTDHPEQSIITVPVYVNIAATVEINPPAIYLRRSPDDSSRTMQRVTCTSTAGGSPVIVQAVSDNPRLTAQVLTLQDGSQVIQVALAADAPPGGYSATITFRTDQPYVMVPDLPVWAEVMDSTFQP